MSKKLLSLAIAICMVAAMLPMTFSSASAVGEVYQFRYDFSTAGFSGSVVSKATYADTNGHWAHSGFLYTEDWISRDAVKNNRLHLSTLGGAIWYALEINVPVSGVYDVKYEYTEIKDAKTKGDVYIFPAGTTLTPGIKFGIGANDIASTAAGKIAENIDYTCTTGDSASNSATYENLNLTAGKNLLVFVATTGGYTYPSALTLTTADATSTGYSDAYVGYVDVAKTTLDAEIAETTTATVAAYKMSDKSAIERGVTFRSSNEAVATVAADGTVTAHKAGTATIYAVCEDPAVGNILGTEITVTAPAYRVAYDFDNGVVENQTGNDPLSNVTYERAYGMWRFIGGVGTAQVKSFRINGSTNAVGQYIALGINVPKTDKYDVDYAYYKIVSGENIYGSKGDVYILPGDTSLSDIEAAKAKGTKIASVDYSSGETSGVIPVDTVKNISLTKGENILLLVVTGEGEYATTAKYYTTPSSLVITTSAAAEDATGFESVYVGEVSLDESALNIGGTTNATASVYTADTTADGVVNGVAVTSGIRYASSNTAVATVDATTGKVTAVGAGKAIIFAEIAEIAEIEDGSIIGSEIIVSTPEDTELKNAFTAEKTDTSYTEPTVNGLIGGKVTKATYKGNGAFDLEAPATNSTGGKFLYWAKGLTTQKRILIGKTNVLTDYVPGENGKTYLIAVYEDEISGDTEYYNANGQLVATKNAPATMPSMAGYGTAIDWKPYGNTNICVADYQLDEPEKNIEITTTLCEVDEDSYGYGDVVTCTATGTEADGIFKCWKKDGEIVSIDNKPYTFRAWKSCTVEAVYVKDEFKYTGETMKIIIDDFDVNGNIGIMAEFLGFGNDVVEKGIMFIDTADNNKEIKIAMTTTDNQFSITADKTGKYVGYAILKSGENAYKLITDGSYSTTAE